MRKELETKIWKLVQDHEPLEDSELEVMMDAVFNRDPVGWKARTWIPLLIAEIYRLQDEMCERIDQERWEKR